MDLFKIDPGLAIWTWVSFIILFIILSKFVFPNIMKMINTREASIAESVEKAERIEQRLEEIEQEHKAIMKRANSEADEILRKTRSDAEALRKKLLEKAENEAREIVNQAKAKMLEDRDAMIEAMQSDIADFVVDTSEKIIGRSFTSADDRSWAMELADSI